MATTQENDFKRLRILLYLIGVDQNLLIEYVKSHPKIFKKSFIEKVIRLKYGINDPNLSSKLKLVLEEVHEFIVY